MRKATLLAVVLLMALSAPLSAIAGFCAKMPCCSAHKASGPTLVSGASGCCSTIACTEIAPTDLQSNPTLHYTPAVSSTARIEPRPAITFLHAPSTTDHSPPPSASERLSQLSTFLI